MKRLLVLVILTTLTITHSFGQRRKDGSHIVSGTEVLNVYTPLTADATAGSTSISVGDGIMTNTFFTDPLETGDLIYIIQHQGAEINIDESPIGWGENFTYPVDSTWGHILNYHNAGMNEFVQVESVAGNTINLSCGLVNSYTVSGHVQVIRVPRLVGLTVQPAAVLTSNAWDGSTGGVVVVEVDSTVNIMNTGTIDVSYLGFRGGVSESHSSPNDWAGQFGSSSTEEGSEKGEGVGGYHAEYDARHSRYTRGSAANGGGGGASRNAGGGGGSNGGDRAGYFAHGNPQSTDPDHFTIWDNEWVGFSLLTSSGGGRGGYASFVNGRDLITTPPGDASWGGGHRRPTGGQGGEPLDYTLNRIYFGGGGGGGHNDNDYGSSGGNGGGIVYIKSYGDVLGDGMILANGESAISTDGGQAGFGSETGVDGAGGGGAGGTIVISTSDTVENTLTLHAIGGNGGDNILSIGVFGDNQANGPGGGGGGGHVSVSNGTPTIDVAGGQGGTSNSSFTSEFPQNGATAGGDGNNLTTQEFFDILRDTLGLCAPGDITIDLTVLGTYPNGTSDTDIGWYTDMFGGTPFHTGASYTTNLTGSVTYYVGLCGMEYRVPIILSVGSGALTIDETNVVLTNPSCAGGDGSITGLTTTGGAAPLSYLWTPGNSTDLDATGLDAGDYTLTVTDQSGCTASTSTFNLTAPGSITFDDTGVMITDETCGNEDGAITGITASGSNLVYEWNGIVTTGIDTVGLAAGDYTLVITDDNGCQVSSGPHTVNSAGVPVIDESLLVVTDAGCSVDNGSVLGLTVSGGSGDYIYEWNGSTQNDIDLQDVGPGDYTLIVTDNVSGCSVQAGPYTVGTQGGPVIDDTFVVIVESGCLTASGEISGITVSGGSSPYTYYWNGTQSSVIDANALTAGDYTLRVVDANGCEATSGPYTVGTAGGPSIDEGNIVVWPENCGAQDGQILNVTVTSPSAYQLVMNGAIVTGPDFTGLATGDYEFIAADINGCTDTVLVNVGTTSSIVIDTTTMTTVADSCSSFYGGVSGISVSGVSNSATYLWSNGDTTLNVDSLVPGYYSLTVYEGSCEETIDSIYVPGTITPELIDTALVITHQSCGVFGSITGLIDTAVGNTYLWSNMATTLDLPFLQANDYELTVTNPDGCEAIYGIYTVIQTDTIWAELVPEHTVYRSGEIFNADGRPFGTVSIDHYTWLIGTDTIGTSQNLDNYLITQTDDFTVCLQAASDLGCASIDCELIEILDEIRIPNVFTPNDGDGWNQVFVIQNLKPNSTFVIFNRWGDKVYESSNYQNDWEGKNMAGVDLSEGVYFFTLLEPTGQNYRGNIHLLRGE